MERRQVPFTGIGLDKSQEYEHKRLKGTGGIFGIIQSPSILLKFCLCNPELAQLTAETEKKLGLADMINAHHHGLSLTRLKRQEDSIEKL